MLCTPHVCAGWWFLVFPHEQMKLQGEGFMVMDDGVRRGNSPLVVNAKVVHLPASYLRFSSVEQHCNKMLYCLKLCNTQ